MNGAKVMVSIVTYNSSKYIKDCVDAALQQTFRDFILVIYDNNSTDHTRSIIDTYRDGRVYTKYGDENIGFGSAHNWTINHFDSEYVLVLNPDAILRPNFLAATLPYFEAEPRIGSTASLLLSDQTDDPVIDCAGITFTRSRRFKLRHSGRPVADLKLKPEYVDGVDGAAAFYRRKAIESIMINRELFDDSYFLYGEDWDVSWRLQLAGWKCMFIPDAVGCHFRQFKQRALSGRKYIDKDIKFHSFKNSIISVIKNDDSLNFVLDCVHIAVRFIMVFVYSLLFEVHSLKAIPYIITNFRKILRARRLIQANRKVSRWNLRKEFILEPAA
jgi:GT2 family glycosyltransferase